MSDELDEDDITSAILTILHGTDQPKGREGWSYNPTWHSAEVKKGKDNINTADGPVKDLNTTSSGDTSPPVTFPPPVTNPPAPKLLPGQAPGPIPIPNMPPANFPPTQVPGSPLVPTAPNIPTVKSPPVGGSNSPPVQAPSVPPVNSPLVQPPSVPPVNSPPVQAPNIPPVNSPPVQAPSVPPVISPPVQAPILPPENSPVPPSTPPAQDSYCPAGPHFNRFSSGPNYVPQSGYDPVGPTLSAQVGNKSYEMAEKFRNVGQSQSSSNTIVVQLQNMGMGGPTVTDFNLTNYLRNPTKYISAEDYRDAYQGAARNILRVKKENCFFHTVTCGKLKNLDYTSAMLLNFIRLGYFLFQFIYPIIVAIVQKGPVAFNVVCTLFAAAGLAYDITQIYLKFRDIRKKKKEEEDKAKSGAGKNNETLSEGVVISPGLPGNINGLPDPVIMGNTTVATAAQDKKSTEEKTTTPREMLREFAQDMLEEIIIYPSLICNLYSFVNERGWEFNDAFAGFDFLLTFISFFMDAVFAKINHIWILYQLIKSTIKVQEQNQIYSYVTPVNLFVPFSIGLAVTHTLMLMLIAIRIYADNFNTKDRDEEPDEGDYSVAPYTRYMIFCGAYLPLMSAACYIILNKHWFLQISWILYNDKDAPQKMNYLNIKSMPIRVKMFGFLRDRYAYIAVSTFAPLFIAFYTGGFLSDYNPDDLPKGALGAANIVGTLFVLVFSIINFQAGIIFSIIMVLLMIMFCVICTGGGSSRNVRNKYIR